MAPAESENKSLALTVLLSLLPGASLVYIGRGRKAVGLFVVDIGVIATIIFSTSYLMRLLALNIYIFTFFSPFLESYQIVKYGRTNLSADSRWYVVVLLLTTGFNALPLLWASNTFSRKAKIAWTVIVPLLAVLFFGFLINYWEQLEETLRTFVERSAS